MKTIETAAGQIGADQLGSVLSHEHVFVLSPELQQNFPHEWGDEDRRVDDAVDKLNRLKECGIDTIIDPTAIGLGRYIPRIARVARRVSLNIVVATGMYVFNDLPMYFRMRPVRDGRDVLTDRFVRDIREGIGGTSIKAGVIKCATDRPGLTPDVDRILRAVAHAHRETGCPITTHSRVAERTGLLQQEVFASEGVDLSRVVIGHCGDTDDLDYLHQLLDAGSYLGMDRFGLGHISYDRRIATVVRLCEEGYADRLMLSHDAGCYMDIIDGEDPGDEHKNFPNWHYEFISRTVLPDLLAAGVSQQQIDQMMIENPRIYLSSIWSGAY